MGAQEQIYEYAWLARLIARDYFLPGAESQDVQQEAMIGLLAAVRDYDPSHGTEFKSFARLCIHRHLQTCVSNANRMKHQPLNNRARHLVSVIDGEVCAVYELVPALGADPADVVERREELARVGRGMQTLTDTERYWLAIAANDGGYANQVDGRRNKQAENAVDRARRKLRAAA